MTVLKSRQDQKLLRHAAAVAGQIMDELLTACQPGVSLDMIETLANQRLTENRCGAPFKQFDNFGYATCVSVNHGIVNGPPVAHTLLKNGDVVSIALGSQYKGICGKVARTVVVGGQPSADVKRLLDGTQAIFRDVQVNPTGFKTYDALIDHMEANAKQYNLTLIQAMAGAGIGRELHEWPTIPNLKSDLEEALPELVVGSAFTLMPMMSLGDNPTFEEAEDGWTYQTVDGSLAAHFAEIILMTPQGLEVLSQP